MCLTCGCMDAHLEMGESNITYGDVKKAADENGRTVATRSTSSSGPWPRSREALVRIRLSSARRRPVRRLGDRARVEGGRAPAAIIGTRWRSTSITRPRRRCAPRCSRRCCRTCTEHLGNPSSIHASGRRARQGLDEAREEIAARDRRQAARDRLHLRRHRGRQPRPQGRRLGASARGRHVVTSAVEHKAVLRCRGDARAPGLRRSPTCRWTDTAGSIRTTWPPPSPSAPPSSASRRRTTRSARCSRWPRSAPSAASAGVPFHTDAVQSAAFAPPTPDAWQATPGQPVGAQAGRPEGDRRAVRAPGYRDAAAAPGRRPGAAAPGGDRERCRRGRASRAAMRLAYAAPMADRGDCATG